MIEQVKGRHGFPTRVYITGQRARVREDEYLSKYHVSRSTGKENGSYISITTQRACTWSVSMVSNGFSNGFENFLQTRESTISLSLSPSLPLSLSPSLIT